MGKKPETEETGTNVAFSATVKEAMAGRNYRQEARRLGIHPGTLYLLARGEGSAELVAKVARGLGQDPGHWLRLAGYEEWVAYKVGTSPADRLRDVVGQRKYKADLEETVGRALEGVVSTPETRDLILRAVEMLRDEERGPVE